MRFSIVFNSMCRFYFLKNSFRIVSRCSTWIGSIHIDNWFFSHSFFLHNSTLSVNFDETLKWIINIIIFSYYIKFIGSVCVDWTVNTQIHILYVFSITITIVLIKYTRNKRKCALRIQVNPRSALYGIPPYYSLRNYCYYLKIFNCI